MPTAIPSTIKKACPFFEDMNRMATRNDKGIRLFYQKPRSELYALTDGDSSHTRALSLKSCYGEASNARGVF